MRKETSEIEKNGKVEVRGENVTPKISSFFERGARSLSLSSQSKVDGKSFTSSRQEKVVGKVGKTSEFEFEFEIYQKSQIQTKK